MIILAWNCRGLARPAAVRALRALVRDKHPDVIFLAETKITDGKLKSCLSALGYPNFVSTPPLHTAGGLCLGWRNGVEIEITLSNNFLINALVFSSPSSQPWMLTTVYGPPYWQTKLAFLDQLDVLANSFVGPLLCLGDFNCILSQDDKYGGRPFVGSSSGGLGALMDSNGLVDMGFSGNPYTWTNKRSNSAHIKERLDRGVANIEWRSLFPEAALLHLPATSSDHCPILLDSLGFSNSVPRPFKFQAMWTRDPSSSLVVDRAWKSFCTGSPTYKFCHKLKESRVALSSWNKAHFGYLHSKINALKNEITNIQSLLPSSTNMESESNLILELDECHKREELLWKQNSRVKWLKEGDRITQFFHLSTIIRSRRNAIDFLKDAAGQWISNREAIGNCFNSHFQCLFSSTNQPVPNGLEGLILPCISLDDNAGLCSIPDESKIREVLFRMGSLKAPGPDGMSVLFYKHYWSIIKYDIVASIRSFFLGGYMLKQINHTHVVLIPKSASASTVKNFRPISLCNVLYKIIAKILANRLQPLLHKLISPMQAAFVPGRLIADNSVIMHEIFHSMKKKMGKGGLMAIKIDMEQAYDKIEWPFLLEVLRCYGFDATWINWIHQCVSTTSFYTLINGGPFGFLKPSRGLRQGDPLSPFLFILCSDVLSRLLNRAEEQGSMHGIKVSRSCPAITHLLFADDLFIFSRASGSEATAILNCLQTYGQWSGQSINQTKSTIHFSRNFSGQPAAAIRAILGLSKTLTTAKCLGLPLFIGNSKRLAFGELISRVKSRITGWKARTLSQTGKSTLIRSVASTIPNYTMSTFLLPNNICATLDACYRNFWWGFKDQGRGLFLKAWDSLCLPKCVGGLGFRRAKDMNKALLAKWGWLLLSGCDSLWATVLKSKYMHQESFQSTAPSHSDSWLWRGILKSQDLVLKGACLTVGNGSSIDLWKDPWIPSIPGFLSFPRGERRLGVNLVADLIFQEGLSWDSDKIISLFDPVIAAKILKLPLSPTRITDKYIWTPNKSGTFSVKSAYLFDNAARLSLAGPYSNKDWNRLWNAKIHERFKVLLWRMSWNILPVRSVLNGRFPINDLSCPLCGAEVETLKHNVLECKITEMIWLSSRWPIRLASFNHLSINDWIITILTNGTGLNLPVEDAPKFLIFAVVLMDCVWMTRNKVLHEEMDIDPRCILAHIDKVANEHLASFVAPSRSIAQRVWIPPPSHWLKLNFDVALRPTFSVLSVVVRDSNGAFIFAWTKKAGPLHPGVAEAQASCFALSEALKHGLSDIVLEGDASSVLNPLSNWSLAPYWELEAYILEARAMLGLWQLWLVNHVPWLANRAAHALAQWAAHCNFFGSIPITSLPPFVLLAEMGEGDVITDVSFPFVQ
ncbi:hypothetical protein L1049_016125 [Liquidambar formosana]|uniref:Reverse transcriptase domain-containing protein n=1 Tax=Liquidambar formosana TaxID=63359 RepID=A0AAP0S5Q7_LIQFO